MKLDRRIVRLIILGVVIVALFVVAHLTGLTASFSTAKVRTLMQSAGAWGVVVFIVAFAVGEIVHVPGMIFVGAAVLAYGRVRGGLLAFAGAIASVSFTFAFVRTVGGKPLASLENRRVKAILAHLDRRPILTVAGVRLVTWMLPAASYALALTNIAFTDYLAGSALGLALPIAVAAALFGIFFR